MKQFQVDELLEWAPKLPTKFRGQYRLGGYDEDRLRRVMWKYLRREQNLRRAWVRINLHLPETLIAEKPLSILEFSTAHGAMLEIWRAYGHEVRGTDFNWDTEPNCNALDRSWKSLALTELRSEISEHPVGEEIYGWTYQPLIESLGLSVDMVDGRHWPYPYEDKSVDIVCCYQAINQYARPEHWVEIAREFCRIARKTVVIGFNPPGVARFYDDYDAACEAWLQFQRFNEAGFRIDFMEIGQTRRGAHPTLCKLIATS